MKNRIYFFTGTGNSLRTAHRIAQTLSDCELIAIHKDTPLQIPGQLDRLGFVFPNYASGPPNMVANFIENMKLPEQQHTYLFLIATYGGVAGSVLSLTGELLQKRGWQPHYGAAVRAYPNAVTLYPMMPGVKLLTGITARRTKQVSRDIAAYSCRAIPEPNAKARHRHADFMTKFKDTDQHYHIADSCISCGICQGVCPAKNIVLVEGRPTFQHRCESCMACVQFCPKQAINYDDKTQKRRRYTHPGISAAMIKDYYKGSVRSFDSKRKRHRQRVQ